MSGALAILAVITGAHVSLSDENVTDVTFTPTNASAAYSLLSTGAIEADTTQGGTVQIGAWIAPTSAAGASYECMATIVSGTLSSGTTGSWLSLGSSRAWSRTRTVGGTSTCVFTLEIRNAANLTVLATATITLEATEEP